MTEAQDHETVGRAIVDASLYMVLGTADESGRPWVSPVYFAPAGYRELFWVSSPEARHSRNLAAREELSIVVFDSSAPIGTGRGVYMTATARRVADDDLGAGIEVFSRRSLAHGGREWTVAEVQPPARLRLYRALASEQWLLVAGDRRVPVRLGER